MGVDPAQVEEFCQKRLAPLERKDGSNPIEVRKQIRQLAFEKVGVVRNEKGLSAALNELPVLREEAECPVTRCKERVFNLEWIEALQNENMVQVLEMVARASLMRTESRGALYRMDFPKVNNIDWLKHIVIRQREGEMDLRTEAVDLSIRQPRTEVRDYGVKE
jgi:succinate dehydrogenase/fumarate reductase flavoprotein subunit